MVEMHILVLSHLIQLLGGDGESRIRYDGRLASLLTPPVVIEQNTSPYDSTSLGPSCLDIVTSMIDPTLFADEDSFMLTVNAQPPVFKLLVNVPVLHPIVIQPTMLDRNVSQAVPLRAALRVERDHVIVTKDLVGRALESFLEIDDLVSKRLPAYDAFVKVV